MIFVLYGSVVVFAIFLAFLVMVKLRPPKTRPLRKLRPLEPLPTPIDVITDVIPGASPVADDEALPPEAAFDAAATQLHVSRQLFTPAEHPKREGAVLSGAVLLCLSGSQKGHSFPVTEKGIAIGRDGANDIVLTDPRVSSHHAWIGFSGDKAVLRDLKSTNGTFLNANAASSVGEVELCPDDTIFFGGHHGDQFRFIALQ